MKFIICWLFLKFVQLFLTFQKIKVSETGFAAGTPHLTLADLTMMCNFSSMVETNLYPELFQDFPELKRW
jgi:hypothetical protein